MAIDENEFFRQVTNRIHSSLDIDIALRRCLDYLKQHMPVAGIFLGVYEPQLNIGRFVASIWPEHWEKAPDTITLPKELWNWAKEGWTGKPKTEYINDPDQAEPPLRRILSMVWPKEISHIHMDLELERKRLGSLHLVADGKNRYTEKHAHLISLMHEPFAAAISNILKHQEILRLKDMLADDNRYLNRQLLKVSGDTIIGANFGLRGVMEMVQQVAPLNSPVLLMGETGVGKEVIANSIHFSSPRKDKPFIRVNCGAIPDSLIDSELFGHEKGAFTGAISRKRGRFERAHTGTIFLDEIAELPVAAQVRLLRVLQQKEIERVGGIESIPVNVRIISATHRNLEQWVRTGRFREDLWFRLNVFPITIPPLRQRTGDIPALVNHFIDHKSKELMIQNRPKLASGALEQLQTYPWPGNVRELENLVERSLIQSQIAGSGGVLRFDWLPREMPGDVTVSAGDKSDAILPMDRIVSDHIRHALNKTNGKVEGKDGAARILGLHPSTLRGRMKKLGIPYGRNQKESSSKELV